MRSPFLSTYPIFLIAWFCASFLVDYCYGDSLDSSPKHKMIELKPDFVDIDIDYGDACAAKQQEVVFHFDVRELATVPICYDDGNCKSYKNDNNFTICYLSKTSSYLEATESSKPTRRFGNGNINECQLCLDTGKCSKNVEAINVGIEIFYEYIKHLAGFRQFVVVTAKWANSASKYCVLKLQDDAKNFNLKIDIILDIIKLSPGVLPNIKNSWDAKHEMASVCHAEVKKKHQMSPDYLAELIIDGAFFEDFNAIFDKKLTNETKFYTNMGKSLIKELNNVSIDLIIWPFEIVCDPNLSRPSNFTIEKCVPWENLSGDIKNCNSSTICFKKEQSAAGNMMDNQKECGNDGQWHFIKAISCGKLNKEGTGIELSFRMMTSFGSDRLDIGSRNFSLNFEFERSRSEATTKTKIFSIVIEEDKVKVKIDLDGVPDIDYKINGTVENLAKDILNAAQDYGKFKILEGKQPTCYNLMQWALNGDNMTDEECVQKVPSIREKLGEKKYKKMRSMKKELDALIALCMEKPPKMECCKQFHIAPPDWWKPPPATNDQQQFPPIEQFKDPDSDLIQEGDILRSPRYLQEKLDNLKKECGIPLEPSRAKRNAVFGKNSRWDPKNDFPIPYQLWETDVDWRKAIRMAIDHIQKLTCVTFVEINESPPTRKAHMHFSDEKACGVPTVGKEHGRNFISIAKTPQCQGRLGSISHEILHVLGIHHEHTRFDRNEYIWIDGAPNTTDWMKINGDTVGQLYDFGSAMHYGSAGDIIALQRPYQNTMGIRSELSFKDAKTVNLLYCKDICTAENRCLHGGYLDPKNCDNCLCPDGYAGTQCQYAMENAKMCGQGNIEIVANLTENVYSFSTEEKGRCYIRIWPRSPYKKVGITLKKMDGFKCTDLFSQDTDDFLEIKYKNDKTVRGARIYCFEHLPDYKIDAEDEAEVMLILDSKGHKKLTIEFEYFASGDVLGELKDSCNCPDPNKLFIPERNPKQEIKIGYNHYRRDECKNEHNVGPWQYKQAIYHCLFYPDGNIFVNGKYHTHPAQDWGPIGGGWGVAKEGTIFIECKQKLDGTSIWIHEDKKFGPIRVDEIMCVGEQD